MAGELWAVNTRFSCLATFDGVHSFVPRWRPPFVSALSPDDRCHLNGLAVSGGRPLFVTAHGRTDDANGWREGKVGGGIVIDVPSGEVVLSGLSMPHSPRFVDGRLWLCDSGSGRVLVADPDTGAVETVAELPGFTRGLAFAGRVAFVGLSQVREHVIADLPAGRPAGRKPVRRVGPRHRDRGHARLPPVRRRRPGDLRRAGPPGRDLPGAGRPRRRPGRGGHRAPAGGDGRARAHGVSSQAAR